MYFNGVKMTGTETTHLDSGWELASNKYWDRTGMIFNLTPFYTNNKPSDEPDRPDAVYAADCMRQSSDNKSWWVKPRILAAAFFSVVLTDAQHQEVYRNMMTL